MTQLLDKVVTAANLTELLTTDVESRSQEYNSRTCKRLLSKHLANLVNKLWVESTSEC